MCNLPGYIEELNAKYAKAAKERDEYKKRCAELEARLEETTKCSDCKHFIPRAWDCDLGDWE